MKAFSHNFQNQKKHKKVSSNFPHANYHYAENKQNQKQSTRYYKQKLHHKSKSFSKQQQKKINHFTSEENYRNLCYPFNKFSEEIRSKLVKKNGPKKKQNNSKDKIFQIHNDYIKSQSECKKNRKKQKLKIRPVKSSPDKSQSKSNKKTRHMRIYSKHFKLNSKKNILKQKKSKSNQISCENNSKNSKKSRNNQVNPLKIAKTNKKKEIQTDLNNKKGVQINFKNISLKQNFQDHHNFPYTSQQVRRCFKNRFRQQELNEMKEYKQIYFLGQNLMQKEQNIIKSARQRNCQKLQNQNDCLVNEQKNYYQTQQYAAFKRYEEDVQDNQFYKYKIGDHIAYRYEILSSINRGSFGQVLKVLDHKTKEKLAMKIVKKSKQLVQQTFVEISILTHIKQTDKANTSGIVRIKDFLLFRNHICILFELLDGNLYELLTANNFRGFSEDIIRVFAVQILNSLSFLKQQNILHCDVKPENLVMKQWGKTGIKLIDFGTSCFQGKQMYSYLQSRYYRAPQVLFQMPYSFPIDMWSFACILAQLKLGEPLFSGRSSTQQLIYIISCIGLPNKNDGLFSLAFLQNKITKEILLNNYLDQGQTINLGQQNFEKVYHKKLKRPCLLSLKDRFARKGNANVYFLDFLQKILVWQPQQRLTPQSALQHPWITKGLPAQIHSLYSASFNTHESGSKSKKNSKQSKASKQSCPKSKKKIKTPRSSIKAQQKNYKKKGNDENKIKYHSKKLSHQEVIIKEDGNTILQNFEHKTVITNINNQHVKNRLTPRKYEQLKEFMNSK